MRSPQVCEGRGQGADRQDQGPGPPGGLVALQSLVPLLLALGDAAHLQGRAQLVRQGACNVMFCAIETLVTLLAARAPPAGGRRRRLGESPCPDGLSDLKSTTIMITCCPSCCDENV